MRMLGSEESREREREEPGSAERTREQIRFRTARDQGGQSSSWDILMILIVSRTPATNPSPRSTRLSQGCVRNF